METRKYFDYAIIKFPTFQNLGEAAKAKCRGISYAYSRKIFRGWKTNDRKICLKNLEKR